MSNEAAQTGGAGVSRGAGLPAKCLLLDLESTMDGRIIKIGAARGTSE